MERTQQIYNPGHIRPAQSRRMRQIINEMHKRSMESLMLYTPLPKQLQFHQSEARIRMNRGSNRAGKSQASGAEVAWAATGLHPHLPYPKENGIIYCVGWDHRHVGQVMWPMVGRPGAFKIVRDEHTKKYRGVRPWQAYDMAVKDKWKDAPPYLPERFIKGISWESRKDDIPKTVKLINGWKIHFASSRGAPQQGIELDLGWIDEEIENEKWFSEMNSRVGQQIIRVVWSATPLAATHQLYELHQKCHSPHNDGSIADFFLKLDDNPYIPQQAKDEFKASLTPEELDVRYYGNFMMGSFMRYPEYRSENFMVKPFTIPPDWTRYMVVDPGRQVCAVLFAAVPPPTKGGKTRPYEVHIYDELYMKACSATKFAEQVKRKMGHACELFEAFIIDHQYGRITEAGIGKTIEEQYSCELEACGVKSRRTVHGFIRGSSDQDGRQESLRRLLQVRPSSGDSALKIHNGKCSNLDWEMQNQFFEKSSKGLVTDKRKRGIADHAVDCLEYLAAFDPQWVPPRKKRGVSVGGVLAYLKKKQNKDRKDQGEFVRLGPPGE